ncbi:hypothetical protein A1O3_04511 [Capronia epimyces CBS 606.96]|uniref:Essential protein Yae1 N-terminal domain-containing protein n=1 Tax=Capronia epimyces CBS 606.96 TaxID=1182542 RepID=W9YE59_9EURO|nr:uncharacterized protein A1O3_04511 [Capronia epimyces CBS 606.96]EXJ87551.1 hypothetical protein A1O3_04511 [Capronia epimyces CBS 606.96]
MSTDPFDALLELENDYYQEGYEEGVADSTYAGMIEGKVFGIEKGYEKALELGKLHGRALVWQARFSEPKSSSQNAEEAANDEVSKSAAVEDLGKLVQTVRMLAPISKNTRLRKHVETLHVASDGRTVARSNSDEAVTEFDDRIAKANAKAKVISNILGESLNPTTSVNGGIEDATGLQARH